MKSKSNFIGFGLVCLCGAIATGGLIVAYRSRAPQREPSPIAQQVPATQLLATPAQATQARVRENFGQLPLRFEANTGQTAAPVKFLARGNGYNLYLTANEAVLRLGKAQSGRPDKKAQHASTAQPVVLRMELAEASATAQTEGLDELPGQSHYFIGNDPAQWRTGVPHFAKVRYRAVYPGIDLIYHGQQRQLEYDFVVAPGADPARIKLKFSGAQRLRVAANGELVLQTAAGEVRQHKPRIYQTVNDNEREIPGGYVFKGPAEVGFEIGAYDTCQPLVIDPVLSYSTYLGGNSEDEGFGIAVDAEGNVYVTGITRSPNFPTTAGVLDTTFGNGFDDAFVTKLNATGTALIYSTYLGGSSGGSSLGNDIAVDAAGNVYVAGETSETNFPTTPGAFQRARGGGSDAFIAKLNPTGSALIYSSYLGGSAEDVAFGLALDATGNAYLTGETRSANFPITQGSVQTRYRRLDAFVTKLNATGTALVYSTYFGGDGRDEGRAISVDAAGNAYVAGSCFTGFPVGDCGTGFPITPGSLQPT